MVVRGRNLFPEQPQITVSEYELVSGLTCKAIHKGFSSVDLRLDTTCKVYLSAFSAAILASGRSYNLACEISQTLTLCDRTWHLKK